MYPAIFKSDEKVNSQLLLEEFENWSHGGLNPIYRGNKGWTGVLVLSSTHINRLDELPQLKKIIKKIGMKHVIGISYFNLEPRADFHRHRDMNGNLLFGISRLHIPIKTNPKVIMEVQKIPYLLGLNEVWCLDTSGLRALKNDSYENRIHIVIDVKRDPQTEKYFPKWSFQVFLHLFQFICIMSFKILRDLFSRPKSVFNRMKSLWKQFSVFKKI